MLDNIMSDIKKERAEFSRDVEYLKETSNDDYLDARIETGESLFIQESADEIEEANNMLNKMEITNVDLMAESTEIDTILKSNEDLTFNEMVGIK